MDMAEVFAYAAKPGRQGKLDWELGGMRVYSKIYSYFLNCFLCQPTEATGEKTLPSFLWKDFPL